MHAICAQFDGIIAVLKNEKPIVVEIDYYHYILMKINYSCTTVP